MRQTRLAAAILILCAPQLFAAKGKVDEKPDNALLKAETFKGLELRSIGPAFMSGRIADIAIDPRDQSTWYVAVGSGNIWKTVNAGTTWTPIFDDQASYSIGCITLDPNDADTVWVGTGENVGGRHVGFGDGVYRSLDGGATWTNMGLKSSEHIGTIVVDPRDSKVIYVAAQGPLWSSGGERGLFKSTDGGENWEKILGGGDYTGVNEVMMDPRDPDVLYAVTHQRFRTVAALINGGPETAIHKSTDGGASWRKLDKGLPEEDMGKIGLAISWQNPDVVYATIELAHRKGGFYRSADGGGTWEKRNDYLSGGTGPHYYQELFASPHAFDRVYQMDVRMHVTEDGGRTFNQVPHEYKHSDNHALAFDPDDPDYLLVGSDGGLYETWDLGENWRFVDNLPITQFYKVAVDNDTPFYNVYGGTQDNNSQGGPSRTDNVSGIRNSDWFVTLFGDGHQPATDPSNPDIVYSQWQQANLVRHDRKTGEIVYIQPQPGPGEPAERWNWDSPILVSPHDPARLYFASQRVWRSDDRGDSWRPLSGDLSRGLDRLKMPMMGRVWSYDAVWDLWAMSNFSNITSISESPLIEGLLYVGTDDGLVHVSEDGGESWRKIDRLPGVPEFGFVNDIKADLHNADTVYVALDNHKTGDYRPFLLKSIDRGRTWQSIVGDLPERHLVWRLVQDHEKKDLLFAGTEFGVFFTIDGGKRWIKLQGGAPNIPFRDLAIQKRENDLVGATFGRSFYILDDYSPLRQVGEELLGTEATLFPVKDTWWYLPKRPLGGSAKAAQGEAFFAAPNPPFGAIFTYYLAEELKTGKQARQEAEKKIAEGGGDTPYPGWDALREESREDDPAILFTVRDAKGEVIRHLSAPVTAGFHRIAWDLRYPSLEAWQPPGEQRDEWRDKPVGPLAPPGAYKVSMAKRVDGLITPLGEEQSFELIPMSETVLPRTPPAEATELLLQVNELKRDVTAAQQVAKTTRTRLAAIREVLLRSTLDSGDLYQQALGLEKGIADLEQTLAGDPLKRGLGEPLAPSISRRLQVIDTGNRASTYGPTEHHLENYHWAVEAFAGVRQAMNDILDETLALEKALDDAGVPWTPGRRVPEPR